MSASKRPAKKIAGRKCAKRLTTRPLVVLHEDNHLLVVDKPAGLATMGSASGPTLHSLAAAYIGRKYNKPGKVFIGIVSRLDSVTSGVIVLARTSKAASRLTPQFASKGDNAASKIYLAAVQGQLDHADGTLDDLIFKDDHACRMRVTRADHPDAKQATLAYQTIRQAEDSTIIVVRLLSGRKHQIRVQFADRGHPILGDRKYGSVAPFTPGIALHSLKLSINHPTLKRRLEFVANPPSCWDAFPIQDAIKKLLN